MSCGWRPALGGIFAGLLLSAQDTPGASTAPTVQWNLPLAVRPAQTLAFDVVLERTATNGRCWSSFGSLERLPSPDRSSNARVRLHLPAADEGLVLLQWQSPQFLSPWRVLALDSVEAAPPSGAGATRETARVLRPPLAVEGNFTALKSDWYRLEAGPTARVVVEVLARRLNSPADPWVKVFDGQGRRLLVMEDTPGLDGDFRFSIAVPSDGIWLELRDTRHGGGPAYAYRLRVASAGWAGGGRVLGQFPDPWTSGGVAVKPVRAIGGREPQELHLGSGPVRVQGEFQAPGEHRFLLVTEGAFPLLVRGRTRGIGSGAELRLRLLEPQGKVIQEPAPDGADEGRLVAVLGAPNRHLLEVGELNGEWGPDARYELELSEGSGVRLVAAAERLSAAPGGMAEVKLSIVPGDAKGTFRPRVAGRRWKVEPAEVPLAKKDVTLQIHLPAESSPGEVHWVGLEGHMTVDGRELRLPVSTLAALKDAWGQRTAIPGVLDGVLQVLVRSPD